MPGTFVYNPATNTVTITGGTEISPADFASFVTADRAGSLTLLNAGVIDANPDIFSLITQLRPCEKRILLLKIVTSANRVGATLDIAGTDGDGAAISENGIDISGAFSAPVYTVLRFAMVNASGITVHGMTNGDTITISQNQWGVIWDKGNGQYRMDAILNVGDGSIATYFGDSGKQIVFKTNLSTTDYITVKAVATFRLGELINAADYRTKNGCALLANSSAEINLIATSVATGLILLYSSTFNHLGTIQIKLDLRNDTSAFQVFNCILDGLNSNCGVYIEMGANGTIYNLTSSVAVRPLNDIKGYCERVIVINAAYPIAFAWAGGATIRNVTSVGSNSGGIYTWGISVSNYLIDCILDSWTIEWNAPDPAGSIYRQYSFNLHLADIVGNNISGATVTLKQADTTQIFSVTTGANGKIAKQTVSHTRYYYSGGAQSTYYGPWTLTITQPGYLPYQDVIVIDRKMDLEVALRYPDYRISTREVSHAVA